MKKRNGLTINLHLTNRWLYTFIFLGVLIAIAVGVYAYGTTNPVAFGHSIGEVDGLGTLAVKNQVNWPADIANIPAGFADGIDNGTTVLTCTARPTSAAGTCNAFCASYGEQCVSAVYTGALPYVVTTCGYSRVPSQLNAVVVE